MRGPCGLYKLGPGSLKWDLFGNEGLDVVMNTALGLIDSPHGEL